MQKFKESDVRLRHKATGLYLHVENLGRPKAENDTYGAESDASIFASKAKAIEVAKRLGLTGGEFGIE